MNVDSSNYEESYIFRDILSSNIADVARIAVIRSQLRRKGSMIRKRSLM